MPQTKPGHIQKYCWNKNRKLNRKNVQCNLTNNSNYNNENDASFEFSMIMDLIRPNNDNNFKESNLSDKINENINCKISGATAHMINSFDNLENASDLKGNVKVGVAKGKTSMNAEKVGNLNVISDQNRNINFKNVHYISKLRRNLFSVRHMDKAGCDARSLSKTIL